MPVKFKIWPYLYLLSFIIFVVILLIVRNGRLYRERRPYTSVQDVLLFPENSTVSTTESVSTLGNIVVPIAAYFDGRPQHFHKNSTVILVDVLENLVNNILGCEVDGVEQSNFQKKPIYLQWWIKSKHPVSHTEVILSCYNINTNRNSSVSVLFSSSGHVIKVPVKREGVVMPGSGVERDGVMICATAYGSPENLDQWLVYQQTIGVEFIHLNVEVSFVKNVNTSETLRRFLASGYVQMVVWMPYLNNHQVFLYSQSFKYQDCIYRYQNVYKYMMIIDFDEYFIPLAPEKDVHWYAQKLLRGTRTASIVLPSIRYYCKIKGSKNMTIPKDGNITKLYNTSYSSLDGAGKSIHIVKFVEEASVHKAVVLLPSYTKIRYRSLQQTRCYIAHIANYFFYTKQCKH